MTDATDEGDIMNAFVGDAAVMGAAFDQLPLIVISPAGQEYRIAAVNGASRAFLGRSDLVGLRLCELTPDANDRHVAELLDRVNRTGQPETGRGWRIPLTGVQGGVTELFVDFTLLPWRSAGGAIGLIAARADAAASPRAQEAPPVALPVLPQASVTARYLISGPAEACGDWLDAITLADGRVALVVGDAVGRGTAVTAGITQIRAVLAELLLEEPDLHAVLPRIDRFVARTPALRAATLALALLDPANGALHYVTCGHPPPLVVGDGTSRFLPATPGGPLGASSPRTLAPARLSPGDMLLLYSDGLVEGAGRTFPVGLSELASAAAALARRQPGDAAAGAADRVCQGTVELMGRGGYTDDVTVLGAQLLPTPVPALHLGLPAEVASLTKIRRAVRQWMAPLGPSDDDQDSVHMAVVETVTNAIEHAYPRGQPGPLEFDLALQPDGQLECLISDFGAWRTPDPAAANRGNGLMVAKHMVDQMLISHPADADAAPAGAASTVVRLLHKLSRPAMPVPGIRADAYRLQAGTSFAVHAQLDGAAARARVRGPVDLSTADDFLRRLLAACRGGTLPLVVDLTGVTYLASAGVSALFRLAGQLRDHQNRLELIASAEGRVQDALKLVGLSYRSAIPPARA